MRSLISEARQGGWGFIGPICTFILCLDLPASLMISLVPTLSGSANNPASAYSIPGILRSWEGSTEPGQWSQAVAPEFALSPSHCLQVDQSHQNDVTWRNPSSALLPCGLGMTLRTFSNSDPIHNQCGKSQEGGSDQSALNQIRASQG